MSEYQFYEFQAIDRPLTREEQEAVGTISSRTFPSSTFAIFEYHYGDFPLDEAKVLARYFDAMLYMANWGSRRLMFRFPAAAVDLKQIRQYSLDDLISVKKSGVYVLLDFYPELDEMESDWIEGNGLLSNLLELRENILAGDFRALYLVWLLGVQKGYLKDQVLEPPVPHGMGELDDAHYHLIEFFSLGNDLVEVAAEASQPLPPERFLNAEEAIRMMPEDERMEFLVGLAESTPGLALQFQRRLQALSGPTIDQFSPAQRTVHQLKTQAETARRQREMEEKRAREEARRQQLEDVAQRKDELWEEVQRLIDLRKPKFYAEAVELLVQLKDSAEMLGGGDEFQYGLEQVKKDYRRLSSLMAKLREAGLLEE